MIKNTNIFNRKKKNKKNHKLVEQNEKRCYNGDCNKTFGKERTGMMVEYGKNNCNSESKGRRGKNDDSNQSLRMSGGEGDEGFGGRYRSTGKYDKWSWD